MESNFNRDFEHYIKENADQYRMFPSDKVWKGVNNALHTRRKWYGFWLGFLLLLTGGAVTWVMSSHPALKNQNATGLKTIPTVTPAEQQIAENSLSAQNIESLLPFTKTPSVADNIYAGQKEFGIIGPPLLLIPDETVIPVISTQPFLEIDYEREFFSVAQRSVSNNNIITNNPAETIVEILDEEKIVETKKSPVIAQPVLQSNTKKEVFYPLTIESVVNAYQFKKIPKRVSWQLFVTPTISYRKLSVNKSIDNPSLTYPFSSLTDVNSAVTHKPDLGLQIGISGRYPITKNIKIRGGFQFNINRYDIKAYAFNGEVATIDLSGGPGNSTISTWTNYRNFNGYRQNWLKNFYFSVSAPIGAELKLFGNAKTNVGIAGTLQPTYTISDRAYMLSTDYKNYAEVPRLIRHVNLNTSFETFVNYTTGKTNWQIGPQVRYQMLSSFQNTYPVKENLFDFGLKIGVTLNK